MRDLCVSECVCVCGSGVGAEHRIGDQPLMQVKMSLWPRTRNNSPLGVLPSLAAHRPPQEVATVVLGRSRESAAAHVFSLTSHPGASPSPEGLERRYFSVAESPGSPTLSKPFAKAGTPGKEHFVLLQWPPFFHISSSWTDFRQISL